MIQWFKSMDDKLKAGPGKYVDYSTARGSIRGLFVCILITMVLWYSHDILSFLRTSLGFPYEINRAKQSWHQTWALIIGLPAIFVSLMALVMIPFNRRRAIESAKGQWFDNAQAGPGEASASEGGSGVEGEDGRGDTTPNKRA